LSNKNPQKNQEGLLWGQKVGDFNALISLVQCGQGRYIVFKSGIPFILVDNPQGIGFDGIGWDGPQKNLTLCIVS